MSVLGELQFGRRNSLPVVLATEGAECGLACMTMIARHYGHDVDLNGLRQRFSLSLAGASLRSLMGIADQLGFSTRALRAELTSLSKLQLPAILHWDMSHFVVLKSINRRNAVIHDPSFGVRRLSLETLSKHFTGVALEVARAQGFEPVTARAPVRLSSLWSRIRGFNLAIVQIIGLSIALQIATFAAPFQLQLVVDEAIGQNDRDLLLVIALAFGGLVIVQALLEGLRGWALRVFGHLLSFQITGNLVRHLLRLPSDYFEKRHAGDIFSRIQAVTPIQKAISDGVISSVIDGLMALVAAVILFFYSTLLALIVIGSVVLNLIAMLAIYPSMKRRLEEEILAGAKEQTHLLESVRSATVLKLMGREAEREAAWRNLHAETTNTSISSGKLGLSRNFIQQVINGLQTVIVTYVAALLVLDGKGFSVGMLFAFLSFRQTFTDRAIGLVNQIFEFRFLRLHLDRLADIITTPTEIGLNAPPVFPVTGQMRLKGVCFRYGVMDPYILDDINLEIKPGEFVAITGPSGSGKTTLMKLMLGLNQPSDGFIELDGYRATPERWRTWRESVGVVAQDDRLLSGTIADNISCFDPDLDMERVQAAAIAARVHEEIACSPMQYMTLVGDMGSTLSGGQRQRVLLARALYRKPKILVLDEGTANLDEENEELIGDLIARMDITRIVVAHRPALVRRAQRVYRILNKSIQTIGNI